MEAYIYQAGMYCEDCGKALRGKLTCPGDPDDERTYDSDDYPKGPYSDGGGESDVPEHCESCGVFLENPLTSEGYAYVREMATDNDSSNDIIRTWLKFYEIEA